ncbi:MAG: glycosyltransferase family 4 protein [Bacteroidales bacterium]|nr:glycosyltransferase family 4 protein [Bacteroidales bacterium]
MNKLADKHVLFLPRWYPNHYDPMLGLFIKYHAEAISNTVKVSVLYAQAAKDISSKYSIDLKTENQVYTVRVYYKPCSSKTPIIIAPLVKAFRFLSAIDKGYRTIIMNAGKPDIVHVHVLTRLGLIAYLLKIFKGIPYLITEHWSRYLPETGTFNGSLRKMLTRLAVRNAVAVTTVTDNLKQAMIAHGLKNRKYLILPNVVDTAKFKPSKNNTDHNKIRFIHVSCFEDRSKNISGILNTLARLSEIREDFECFFVGVGMDFEIMKNKADKLNLLNKNVFFTGLLEGDEISNIISSVDFMILFSNYENMPVVINEAFACGIPVVSSRVGGIPEYVKEETGILVEPGNENDFLEKIIHMMDNFSEYDKSKIRKFAVESFSKEAIARQLINLYAHILPGEKRRE